jgi:hypothetical protein
VITFGVGGGGSVLTGVGLGAEKQRKTGINIIKHKMNIWYTILMRFTYLYK